MSEQTVWSGAVKSKTTGLQDKQQKRQLTEWIAREQAQGRAQRARGYASPLARVTQMWACSQATEWRDQLLISPQLIYSISEQTGEEK